MFYCLFSDRFLLAADYLIQSGLASHIHFHGKRFAWFVSDVTRKDWDWLLNSMVYGQLFPSASEVRGLLTVYFGFPLSSFPSSLDGL